MAAANQRQLLLEYRCFTLPRRTNKDKFQLGCKRTLIRGLRVSFEPISGHIIIL